MLASTVMDQAAALLNDTALSLFTYAAQLPYLKLASQKLEQILIAAGVPVQDARASDAAVIDVPAATSASNLTLPANFLLPVTLWERADGSTDNDAWEPMVEQLWEQDMRPATTLTFWSFRNNQVKLAPCSAAREVQMNYIRALGAITGSGSTIDLDLSKNYLAAKTAELCARFIGMNSALADEIRDNEVLPSKNELETVYILNNQGMPARRQKLFRR